MVSMDPKSHIDRELTCLENPEILDKVSATTAPTYMVSHIAWSGTHYVKIKITVTTLISKVLAPMNQRKADLRGS